MRVFFSIVLLFFITLISFSQETDDFSYFQTKGEPYHFSSDELEDRVIGDDQRLTILTGNVNVSHGTITIMGDKAWIYHDEQRVMIQNNVKIIDKTTIITGKRGVYQRKSNRLTLYGPVTVQDTSLSLKASEIVYLRDKQEIEGYGNIEIIDEDNDAILTGNQVRYSRNEDYGVIKGSPILKTFDREEGEPITISSDKMEVFREENKAVATSNVEIIRGDVSANCLVATYFNKEEKFVLSGYPTVEQEKNNMSADEIQLFISEQELDEVKLLGSAKVNYHPPDGSAVKESSLILGENIAIFFEDEAIKSIQIDGSAESIYYPDQDELIGDRNMVSGGKMNLIVEDNEISKVLIEGKANGTYRFFEEVK